MKNIRALLVHPGIPDTYWSFKHAVRFLRKKALSPPLGLLTVAAMLPREWEKRVVDLNVTTLTDTDLAWADYVLISAMSVQKKSAREIIDRCRPFNVKIIAGGMLFTSEYDDYLDVDHLVLGEAEQSLPPFLEDLEKGSAGRIYRAEGFPGLDATPIPLWDLIDLDDYVSMSIQLSRGCPHNCDFCTVTMLYGNKWRTKETGQIIAELNALYDRGWRAGVFFVDDNFTVNKKHLETDLLPALIDWRRGKKGLEFCTQSTINLADDQPLMNMMTDSGFNQVFIGIETPDEASLAECGKSQNKKRELIRDVKRLHQAGLQVQAGFIVGFDNDTPAIFPQLIEFIQDSGIITAIVGMLQAPAGTKLHKKLEKDGRILGHMGGDHTDGTTNIVPRMGFPALKKGYMKVLETIYSSERFYQRLRTFLRDYEPPPTASYFEARNLLALCRVFFHLGVIGKERVLFWKLLGWTIRHRRRNIHLALSLATYGYHFRKFFKHKHRLG